MNILLMHGPNLNLLGSRETAIYGSTTLAEIEKRTAALAAENGFKLDAFQSNHEGALIDHLQAQKGSHHALLINPGGLAHTSVALRDAIAAFKGGDTVDGENQISQSKPCVEVHISNVFARETFRHTLITAGAASACISGFGYDGYRCALAFVFDNLRAKAPNF